jgi:hypothetical protein
MVNKTYIQFRAIISGISDSDSADWEEIKYLGKPDSIYHYKGYTRTLNFNFSVAITSIRELYPTWRKLNYLKGMSKPSTYSGGDSFDENGNYENVGRFMVPPLIQLRLGDMFKNVPIAMSTININIPDDATWEILPDDSGDYTYLTTVVPNVRWGQYPTRVDVSISAYVLEREDYPRIGNTVYGGDQSDLSSKFVLRTVQDSLNSEGKIKLGKYTTPSIDKTVPIPTQNELSLSKTDSQFSLTSAPAPLDNRINTSLYESDSDVASSNPFNTQI